MTVERSQTRNARIGAGIVAGLLAMAMFVFFVPKIVRWIQPTITIVAIMDDAGALKDESPVWLAGREIGTVISVGFRGAHTDSSERVAVRMQVPKKYASQIRRDSQARITSTSLIGEPVLDITPGSAAAAPLENLDTLRVRPRGRLEAVLDKTETLNAAFAQLFAEMRAYKRPAERRARDLQRIEHQLDRSMTGFRELVAALNTSPLRTFSDPAWKRLLDDLSANARQLEAAFEGAAERARAALSDTRPSLERLAARADTISDILTDLQARMTEGGGGFLIRAQRDSAIVKRLGEVQTQLDSLVEETRRNPLRFWF